MKRTNSNNNINVSEIFHSIQGEGPTSGKPSVFLRLQACNLMCGGMGTQKDRELHDGATWRCDTIEVWMEGDQLTTKSLAAHLFNEYSQQFLNGSQLIITGGEPLLQQDQFSDLLGKLQSQLAKQVRLEIETNGTIVPTVDEITNQYNVSPKLSNSGMPKKRRIKPEAMESFANLAHQNKAFFKFVVTREEDIGEIIDDYINPFAIPSNRIWLMPGCSNKEQFSKVAPKVAEICQKYGLNFTSRLQINLWNETTGV